VERLGFQVGTWNVDSLTDRAGEVVEALLDRKVDVACIQETRWKGSGCKFYGAKGKRYKMFLMGGEERSDNVGIFVAEKWVDGVVIAERHSKRVLHQNHYQQANQSTWINRKIAKKKCQKFTQQYCQVNMVTGNVSTCNTKNDNT